MTSVLGAYILLPLNNNHSLEVITLTNVIVNWSTYLLKRCIALLLLTSWKPALALSGLPLCPGSLGPGVPATVDSQSGCSSRSAPLHSVLLFRLLKESSRTFLFQQHKSVQLLFLFFNVTHFVLIWHVTTSPQVLPQALPPPPGENSPYSPSDRSAWFVKDYWKSARTKSERSTMRYWQRSWQVCLFFKIVAQHNSSQVRHHTGH